MNYKQLINAYVTLTRMGGAQMEVKTAMTLYKVRKTLEPYYQFCVEREEAIMDRHEGRIVDGNVTFAKAEDAVSAQTELNELYLTEVEDNFIPVEVQMDSLKECTLSLNDVEALDGIIALI